MTRVAALASRASLAGVLVLAACGGDDDGIDPCAVGTPTPTTPVIVCPGDVAVCVPAAGAPVDFDVRASACEGGAPAVTCSPERGASLSAGSYDVTCTARAVSGEHASCSFVVRATRSGAPSLSCPPDVARTCTGTTTAVALDPPTIDATCGSTTSDVTSDAPPGYPVGSTTVTFSVTGDDGASAECSTTVTVDDVTPPSIECAAASVVVLASPGDPGVPPAPTVDDDCDAAPALTFEPEVLARGTNDVLYTATDASGLTNSCTTRVDVLEAFAPEGVRVVSAELAPDATTDVTLAWDDGGGADTSGFAIERAPAADGPFTRLDAVGPTARTYTDEALTDAHAYYRVIALAGDADGGASAAVEAWSIAATAYDLRGQTVPTIPFATTLYGVVRHPVDLAGGPYPLVVMLHGNHGICRRTAASTNDSCATSNDHECPTAGWLTTPNAEGLVYLAETVAAQGYIAVTISGNAVNCRETWIAERAELIAEHLRRWAAWSGGSAPPFGRTFAGAVDLGRVALFGHSRGAEAVAHVPALLRRTPIAGVALASVFSLAPTDYDMPAPSDVPYAVALPGCDGDVSTLVGSDIWDRSIRATDDAPRAQVLFPRANHNYFNTEWRNDDNNGAACTVSHEIGPAAQRGMLEGVLGAWLAGTVRGPSPEPFVRADAPTPEGIEAWADAALDLRWSYVARRVLVDDLEGAGSPGTNRLGGSNTFVAYETSSRCYDNACGGSYPHEKGAMRFRWDGGTPVASWGLAGLDASGYGYLSFRVVSRPSTFNSGVTDQAFVIRAIDGAGVSAEVLSSDFVRVPHLYDARNPLEILQTVRVPLAAFEAASPGLDVSSLDRAELEMTAPGHTRGSVLVSDVTLGE